MITITNPGFWDTRSVCDHLEVTPALLRLWESRYGWPCPRRTATGQRRFSATDVDELAQVLALVRSGRPIGSILLDGRPNLPRLEPEVRQPLGSAELATCPKPVTEAGQDLREQVVAAMRRRDLGEVRECCHRVLRACRPDDRAAAVWEPVLALCQAWEAAQRPLPGVESLRSLVETAAGSALHTECVA
jgi:DNA-binding transcriptional MerR regulator